MHKYVYEILQELSVHQRPTSRQRSSRCFSTQDQNETVKTSLILKDKQLKSYLLTKINQIQAEKQILLAKKRKALILYKMILDKMVSPLIEYMPSVATSYHLSKLTDFRTNDGFSERTEETNKQIIIVRPKCVEEPLPILIKPEYKVSKCRKKSWKIMNKLAKARDSKNEIVKKYKSWKSKVAKEPEIQKQICKKHGLLVYDLFLKDTIESKIEDLMPAIKAENKHSNVYDFRFQNEPEFENCENHHELPVHEEVVSSPKKLTNLNKAPNNNNSKSIISKPIHTKTTKKADPISSKTKPYDALPLKKNEEKAQMLKVKPAVHSKEESQAKLSAQRTQQKPNWARSDNRMKVVKSETAKNKPLMKNTVIPSKSQKPEVIQPARNNTLSAENKVSNSSACTRQNVDEKEVANSHLTGAGNIVEMLHEKNNGSALLQDGMFQPTDNIVDETRKSDINVAEKSVNHFDIEEDKENTTSYPHMTYAGNEAESAIVEPLEEHDTQNDLKSNIIIDEPNNVIGNSASQSGLTFDLGRDLEENMSQNENRTIKLNGEIKNVNNLSECVLLDDPNTTNSLGVATKCEEKPIKSDSNELKSTYLVSFVVNNDEAIFKTRSQLIGDEIKGDLIDLNTVLAEEKKEREARRRESLSENLKSTTDDLNMRLKASKSETQRQNKVNLLQSADKNKNNNKNHIKSAINKGLSSEPFTGNLSKTISTNSFKPNSASNTNENTRALKENNISDGNLNKKIGLSDMNRPIQKRTLEPNKDNIIKYDKGHSKSEGRVLNEINNEYKKHLTKTQSLEHIGREKNGKVLQKKGVTEKERNILSSIPVERIKNMNKLKGLDKSEKYQEIINSVKNIIPSNSNESILGRNTHKVVLTGTKIKSNINATKSYTKTIDELKQIISELPEIDNHQTISAAKYSREGEGKSNKTSKNFKTAEEENVVLKDEILDSKQTNTKANNKINRINLKTIKVVDKIEKVNEELETNADKINTEASLTQSKENEDYKTHLKPSKANTSINKIMLENDKLGSQIAQKERVEESSDNLSKTDRISNLKHQRLSNHSDKIDETTLSKEGMFSERTLKPLSIGNAIGNEIKSDKRKESVRLNSTPKKSDKVKTKLTITGLNKEERSREKRKIVKSKSDSNMNKIEARDVKGPIKVNTSLENNRSGGIERGVPITESGTLLQKINDEFIGESKENKSKEETDATLKENYTFVSTEMNNNKTNLNENGKLKFNLENFVKSANNSIENQRKVIKFTRVDETMPKKNFNSENNLIKVEKKETPPVCTMKGKHSGEKTMDIQTIESKKPINTSSTVLKGKNKKTELKVKNKMQLTGIFANKMPKIKVISNEKPKRIIQSSKITGVGKSTKSSVQSRVQVNSGDIKNEEVLNVGKILANR